MGKMAPAAESEKNRREAVRVSQNIFARHRKSVEGKLHSPVSVPEEKKMNMVCTLCGEPMPETEIKTRFYFMRHGRTQMNEDSITIGSIDEPMNETGKRQAQEATEQFRKSGITFDLIIASPLMRARETAKIIGAGLEVSVITDNRLRERNVGILEGKPETPQNDSRLLDYDFKPKGAEPLESFEKETKEFLQDIEKTYRGKRVLFITHGFRMLTLVKLIHGWDVEKTMAYEPPKNCEKIGFEISEPCAKCGNKFFEKTKFNMITKL